MKNKNYLHKNAIHHKTDEEIKKEITAICEKSLHLASQINSSWSDSVLKHLYYQNQVDTIKASNLMPLFFNGFSLTI